VTNPQARYERLTTGILLLVVAYGVGIFKVLGEPASIAAPLQWLVTLLSSGALYKTLVRGSLTLINRSDRLLSFYWGSPLFLKGLWHYTSEEGGKVKLGVWRIDQDALRIQIRAFGLDEQYSRRFTAFSITDLMEVGGSPGVYEVVNARHSYDDHPSGDVQIYSKTRIIPESPVSLGLLLQGPKVMRGETIVYGGPRSGALNRNVILTRHHGLHSEGELIERLRRDGIAHGRRV
jgi:hypothetical protein